MKAKLTAGAEFDFLTKGEVDAALRGWMSELVRGIKYVPIGMQTLKTAATFTIGPNSVLAGGGQLGPAEGFCWAVMSVNVNGPGIAAADTFTIYDSDVSGTRVRVPLLTNAGKSFQKGEFVLQGPGKLFVTGGSTGAGNEIFVSGTAIEVPEQLKWQLC